MTLLDETDRRLLRLLQEDNQLTNLELAERANLSPPTCLRRVRRLRDDKIIVGNVALLDPLKVGKNLFAFVEIVLDRQNEQLQQEFERAMARCDEVMQCYMVSGDTDFIVVVQISDMDAYHRFVRETLTNDPNVRNFRTMFAMNRSKFRTQIKLDGG